MKYAITDLGSNTIRLSVFNTLENGTFETLFTKKVMAGLAGYVVDDLMTPDGVNQACAVLLDFQFLLHQLGIDTMYPFATASSREFSSTSVAAAQKSWRLRKEKSKIPRVLVSVL